MKFIFSFLLSLSTILISAQTVEILQQAENGKTVEVDDFVYLEANTDTSALNFVATIKVTGKDIRSTISSLYKQARKQARKLGANSFKFKSHRNFGKPNTAILILELYHASEAMLDSNFNNQNKNVIYLFGNANIADENYSFKINNVKKMLLHGTYFEHTLSEDSAVSINKGGFLGTTITLRWTSNKPATFLTLSGFGMGGAYGGNGGAGISFNSGSIRSINPSYGMLLTRVLLPHQEVSTSTISQ